MHLCIRSLPCACLLLIWSSAAVATPRGDLERIFFSVEDEFVFTSPGSSEFSADIALTMTCSPLVAPANHAFRVDFVGLAFDAPGPNGNIELFQVKADGFVWSRPPVDAIIGTQTNVLPQMELVQLSASEEIRIRYTQKNQQVGEHSIGVVATGVMPRDCTVEIEAADM